MTVPHTCISLLSARRVSCSYTEQIGCMHSVNTQKFQLAEIMYGSCLINP